MIFRKLAYTWMANCMNFHSVTVKVHPLSDFWPNLNFPLEHEMNPSEIPYETIIAVCRMEVCEVSERLRFIVSKCLF